MIGSVSFHVQNSPNNWLDAIAKLPDGSPVKLVMGAERAREVKAVNDSLVTWYRWVAPDQNLAPGNYEAQAIAYFNRFIDDTFKSGHVAPYVDIIQEPFNEYLANGQNDAERQHWVNWAAACAKVWAELYRQDSRLSHIRLVLGGAGVGNDLPLDFARLAVQYDCLLDSHSYTPVANGVIMPDSGTHPDRLPRSFYGELEDWQITSLQSHRFIWEPEYRTLADFATMAGGEINGWKYYEGRFSYMDEYYISQGYRVDWALGEGGPVRDASPWWGNLQPQDGWNHKDCCNRSVDCYLRVIEHWLDNAVQTTAYKEGRLLGMTLFTSGGPGTLWDGFETKQPEMNTIADFVRVYLDDVNPPPPPPPDPGELVNGSFEDGWTDQSMTAQQPNGWTLDIAHSGDVRGNAISGTPECVHKRNRDLPPDEQKGGENALILDGETCYKMFTQAVWRATLRQTVSGLEPGAEATLIVPANIHFDGRGEVYDADDTLLKISLNGQFIERWMTKEQDRTWVYSFVETVVPEDGKLHIEIEASVKRAHPTAFFFDAIQLDFDVDPPPPPEPDCKGLPRKQYKRRSLVVPQNISKTDWLAVAQTAYENKNTVGFSYDDAGVGDLDSKTAVLYGIPTSSRQTFIDWYAKHYPGTIVLFGTYGEPMPVGVFVDVSHNNGVMDWPKAKAEGVTHAYIKASDWSGRNPWKDPEFDRNWAEAKAVGIQRGAYHFYRNYADPTEQAMSFLEVLGDDHGELPAALDVEDDSPTDANDLWSWLLMVEEALQAAPVIYTAAWIWNKRLDGTAWASDYALWVANWTTADAPLIPNDWAANGYWLWQYDNRGDCKLYGGTARYIDLNRFG